MYIIYGLGILVCAIILVTYKPKGWLNLTNLFVSVVMLVFIVALLVSIITPATFGMVKKILFGLFIGIGVVVLLILGINAQDAYRQRSRHEKHSAKIKEHKEHYASLEVLENVSIEYGNGGVGLQPITAKIVLSDTVPDYWDAEFIVFARPRKESLLRNYTLFKSKKMLVGKDKKRIMIAEHAWHAYDMETLQKKVGDTIHLEYLLLLKNPKETYVEYGLNEGLAYTSLSDADIEMQNGSFDNVFGKTYALVRSPKMPKARQIPLSILSASLLIKEERKVRMGDD